MEARQRRGAAIEAAKPQWRLNAKNKSAAIAATKPAWRLIAQKRMPVKTITLGGVLELHAQALGQLAAAAIGQPGNGTQQFHPVST